MAPTTRRNSALARKISTLQLRLAPLVPLPSGPPHPNFPKTLMAFHLLTEDELDSIAHYYHQSTPGPWTHHYPASMNWDKEFLAKPAALGGAAAGDRKERGHVRRLSAQEVGFVDELMALVAEKPGVLAWGRAGEGDGVAGGAGGGREKSYEGLSEKERVRIKRRKVGKFIGLVGMETPVEEIAGRIQASLDRAVLRGREELRRDEEFMMRRRKMA
ncbi:hypothetical protein MBLNU230_g4938t1 [Neophaeotheca triangularis]